MRIINILTLLVATLVPTIVFAALGLERAESVAMDNGLFIGTISEVIQAIVVWLMSIISVIALVALVWAGFLYISAFTNEKNVEKAKDIAKYAIIGLLIAGGSFLVLSVIRGLILS